MRGAIAVLVALLLVLAGPSWAQQKGGGGGPSSGGGPGPGAQHDGERNLASDQVAGPPRSQFVALLSKKDPAEAQRLAKRLAGELTLGVVDLYGLFSMEATLAVFDMLTRQPPETVVLRLSQDSRVIAADLNHALPILGAPPSQLQYAPQLLGAERVHATLRGRNILVAIVDTGIDAAHEDLRGAVVAQESLVEGDTQLRAGVHSTAEAGIIAARQGVETGIVGMAPEARIVALRACVPAAPGATEATCLAHRVARGVDAAVRYGAQILNLSLGGPAPNRVVTRLVLQAMVVHRSAEVAAATTARPRPRSTRQRFPA